ncbi:MAG: DUF917 domain-containing protein [Firmicutes bacterium]|nr:DUF917 domain-containing protein [Bacillota bacterium]
MRTIDVDETSDLAVGATLFGAGGGGDPYIGQLMARDAIQRHGAVPLISIDELPKRGLVLPVAMMGAPTVLVEKIPSGEELGRVIETMQAYFEQPVVAVMPAEIGGINATIPFVAAATLGLPVLDADGMGRAFPEIPMCSMSLSGVLANPMVVTDEKGNVVTLRTIDDDWSERLSRTATVAMGGASIIALYAMQTQQVPNAVIPASVSRAIDAGRRLRQARQATAVDVETLLAPFGAKLLFRGRVTDVLRRTVAGFARGQATLAGLDADRGDVLTLDFQNEHLIARRNDRVCATVPDLITLLDAEAHLPITTEGIAYGQRVDVLGLPCDPFWRTPQALARVGPAYFGYSLPYQPLQTTP